MELRDTFMLVWRRRWLVILATLVAGASALAYAQRQINMYQATAKVFIGPGTGASPSTDVSALVQQSTLSGDFLTSYAAVLQTRTLAAQVVSQANLPLSPDTLASRVKATVITNTRIIQVSVSDPSSERAALAANTLVNAFVKSSLTEFGGQAGVLASVLEPATVPTAPVSPKPLRDAALGAFLGLMLGVGVAFLLDRLDTRLRARGDVEQLLAPLPTLAAIPAVHARKGQMLFARDSDAPVAEAFRILRTNVQFFSLDQPFARILVTSAQARDGKTVVAANLAASLAATGSRTLLVEADLRRPTVSPYFATAPAPGLADLLEGTATVAEAIHATPIPNLSVVPAGTIPTNPSELLGSARMVEVLDALAEGIDVVVVDTPPALVVTDAALLAGQVDGVVLVVRAGSTHRTGAVKTKELFDRIGSQVFGVVVNCATAADGYGSAYNYQYYSTQPRKPAKAEGSAAHSVRAAVVANGHVRTPTAGVNVAADAHQNNGHSGNGNGAAEAETNGHGPMPPETELVNLDSAATLGLASAYRNGTGRARNTGPEESDLSGHQEGAP